MSIYTLDPTTDPRWSEFIERHPGASVVHTVGWLNALHRTYGYRPVVYTTSPSAAPLANGAAFCRISSWLTGRRLVSLPFSDHCDLLSENPHEQLEIVMALQETFARERLKYIELRPLDSDSFHHATWEERAPYCFHALDLRPPLEELFRAAHKTAVQQPIRRAEREGLAYDEGRTERLLGEFYRLLLMTRRRHGIPPQPIHWFRNLLSCMGDRLKIRSASKDGQTIASIITLNWKGTVTYKYGCSDAAFHNLGGIHFLLWKTIQESKGAGAHRLDFGRSEADNAGLIAFKDRWGAQRSSLTYLRHAAQPQRADEGYGTRLLHQLFARMPNEIQTAAGQLLYRHIG